MFKSLKCEFCVTEQDKETPVGRSIECTENDKSDGEIREIEGGNGDLISKGNGTNSLYELEHNNKLLNEEANCGSSSSDILVEEEGKKKKRVDSVMLTRFRKSRLRGPNTQACTPLGSKKASNQSAPNSCCSPSSKYTLHYRVC
jgi:hypothetical protein